jgi:hypothetical protein
MAAFGLGVAFVVMHYTVRTPFLSPDNMHPEIQIQREIDGERFRVRLRGMTDEQLCQFGKAARYMISPNASTGKPPLEAFVFQWQEARAEWRTRYPKEYKPGQSIRVKHSGGRSWRRV